jgi:hypothetical protein
MIPFVFPALFAAAAVYAGPHEETPMTHVWLSKLKRGEKDGDYEAAKSFSPRKKLPFRIVSAVASPELITVLGELSNPFDEAVDIVIGGDPFALTLQPDKRIVRKAPPPSGVVTAQPWQLVAPIAPRMRVVPPRTAVQVQETFSLDPYRYEEGVTAKVEWSFRYWSAEVSRGVVDVTLAHGGP